MDDKRVSLWFLPFVIFTTVSAVLSPVGLLAAENKFYWADNEARNWTESVAFCKTNGYLLATGLTRLAVNFLKEKHNVVTFTGTHWISATTREVPKSLAWDSPTGTTFTNLFGITWREPDLPLCGAFYSAGDSSYFRTLIASLNYKTLCEESIP